MCCTDNSVFSSISLFTFFSVKNNCTANSTHIESKKMKRRKFFDSMFCPDFFSPLLLDFSVTLVMDGCAVMQSQETVFYCVF